MTDLVPEKSLEQGFMDKWMEFTIAADFKILHIIFIFCSVVFIILVFLCCCIRFRIPRTKQEIEADYIRKKITRKFQRQLFLIQDSEMEEMNLLRALEIVRNGLAGENMRLMQDAPINIESSPVRNNENTVLHKRPAEEKSIVGNPYKDNTASLSKEMSQEKLFSREGNSLGTKIVTIVSALNVLRSRKTRNPGKSREITV